MSAQHHDIQIVRSGNDVVPPKPMPQMAVGDTVRYVFNGEGRVTIVFPQLSPFRTDLTKNTTVAGAETHTIQRDGFFPSGCRIALANGEQIGWDPANPDATFESGGEHRVGH